MVRLACWRCRRPHQGVDALLSSGLVRTASTTAAAAAGAAKSSSWPLPSSPPLPCSPGGDNQPRYNGVAFRPRRNKWAAQVTARNVPQKLFIGEFATAQHAAAAFNACVTILEDAGFKVKLQKNPGLSLHETPVRFTVWLVGGHTQALTACTCHSAGRWLYHVCTGVRMYACGGGCVCCTLRL